MIDGRCRICLCNTCGLMHECEVLLDKIIDMDTHQKKDCEIIINCSHYTSEKSRTRHKTWNCDVRIAREKGEQKDGDNYVTR